MSNILQAGVLALCLILSACAQQSENGKLEEVSVVSTGGTHRFKVEIADDDVEREKGLMNRPELKADRGMLFIFPTAAERTFWMHNTLIPLDIIYITPGGEVLSIQKNTVPMNDTPLPSYGPASVVLEIQGGLSDKLGIRPGDRIEHRVFETAQ
ncbi:DUF192 domain-containing protein [Asticcacaulis sp. YBE204]|uniref:DUF192 domain-containing protein n=1 Tax=Asticcacaulis sp. YBE204 TaxID=1282363 RepID=UPI0003C3F4B1|nr:DUF192 domain-containing protein [Asticcacaulis sp. YBE204]ESQ77052.1 hypothetical protein AEYBE204_18385 [Asticcacaulis sp. YBE204]